MLKIENLTARYGSIEALHGISLQVDEHEMVSLIGANGAGKTTLLNSISGTVSTTGSISFQGTEILQAKAARIARLGLLQVPEGRHVFPGLTVEENLLVGTVASRGMRLRAGDSSGDMEMVFAIFPRLKERRRQLAWSMSGGEQQMLAIGRALITKPKLILADEPTGNLDSKNSRDVMELLTQASRHYQQTILMITHNRNLTASVDRVFQVADGVLTDLGGEADETLS